MKKKAIKQRFKQKTKKTIISLLTALIISFFAWTTHSVSTARLPDPGIPSELYASENNDDLRQVYRSAINSAEHSIYLLVYTLTDETIIQALKDKAAQGVKVEVIVDAKASPHAAQKLGSQIKTLRRLGEGLMHFKILVVDQKLSLVGSSNMTAESLQKHSNLVMGMHSPDLANYLITKAQSLTETERLAKLAHETFSIGGQQVSFWFLPDDAKEGATKIKELIRSAKKTIRVAMFTFTRQDFAHEIIRAAKQGINVQVVIDNASGKGSSAKIVQLLKSHHIDVHLSKGPGLLHHKFMVIDRQTLVNGSANWTKAAFGTNDDCFMIIENLTNEQKEQLDSEWDVLYAHSTAP